MNLCRKYLSISVAAIVCILYQNACADRMWGDQGILLSTSITSDSPRVCSLDGRGIAVTFRSLDSSGVVRLSIQGLNRDGDILFAPSPLFVSSDNEVLQRYTDLLRSTPDGGVMAFWCAQDNEHQAAIFAQRFDDELNTLWQEGGRFLYDVQDGNPIYPYIADDGGFFTLEIFPNDDVQPHQRQVLVRKFDADGDLADGWPAEGRPVFQTLCRPFIYPEPGSGIWVLGQGDRDNPPYLVNEVMADGSLRYNIAVQPALPNETLMMVSLTPDRQGGFFLNLLALDPNNDLRVLTGIQHYQGEDGNPVWPNNQVWLDAVDIDHIPSQIFVPESADRLYYFKYLGDLGEMSIQTRIDAFSFDDDGIESVWEEPLDLQNVYAVPRYEAENGAIMLHVSQIEFNEHNRQWEITGAQANELLPEGEMAFGDSGAPVDQNGFIIPALDGEFFTTHAIVNGLQAALFDGNGEPVWEENNVTVFQHPPAASIVERQLLPDDIVRVIERSTSGIGYRLIYPDADQRAAPELILFIDRSTPLYISSGASFCFLLRGEDNHPSHVALFDSQNRLQPDEPLPIADIIGNGDYQAIKPDSTGGFFILYDLEQDNLPECNLVHLNDQCDWDEETISPFPLVASDQIETCPMGDGGAWIFAKRGDFDYLLQKLSLDNVLEWDAELELDWSGPKIYHYSLLSKQAEALTLFSARVSRQPDSLNVFAMRYDSDGLPVWETTASLFEPNVGIETDGRSWLQWSAVQRIDGGIWVAAWVMESGNGDCSVVRLQQLTEAGERVFGDRGLELPGIARNCDPRLLLDSNDGIWIFFVEAGADYNPERVIHLDRLGNPLNDGDMDGYPVVIDNQAYVRILEPWSYPDNSVGVVYKKSTDSFIYLAQRLSSDEAGVELDHSISPNRIKINSLFPNPTNGELKIEYSLKMTTRLKIQLVDLTGRSVGSIFDGVQFGGVHNISVSLPEIPSGLYFVQFTTEGSALRSELVMIN